MRGIFCATLSKNQGAFLEACLESIHDQPYLDRHVVYDLASKDETQKILDEYGNRIEVIFRESDSGPSEGLNVCARLNNSEIFCYLNADDVFAPNAFDFVVRFFEQNPDIDIVHGSIFIIDENGKKMKLLLAEKFTLRKYALRACVVNQQATFIRSRILSQEPFSLKNRISWDGELIVDLVKAGAKIKNVRQVLGYFRIHSSSITSSSDYKSRVETQHRIIEKKILGDELTQTQRFAGVIYSKILAFKRKMFVSILPQSLFTKLGN